MRYLIYKVFTRVFFIALNYKHSKLREFLMDEMANSSNHFSEINYSRYRLKYKLNEGFRFNGILILLYGEGKIQIGSNSYIGDYSTIYSHENSEVRIGCNVRIGPNVRMYTQSLVADQDFSKNSNISKIGDIVIGDDSWVGANVFINPGVVIGKNVVIGANSVVINDVPDNTIFGGVPAKLLRNKAL